MLSRLRWDQRTRDYLERRTAEGKTRREAVRCLKRRRLDIHRGIKLDAVWLCKVAERQMLRPNFVPPAIRRLRDLTPYRATW